jgi:hypothetical protein
VPAAKPISKGKRIFSYSTFFAKLWWQRHIIIHLYWIDYPKALIILLFSAYDSRWSTHFIAFLIVSSPIVWKKRKCYT